MMDLEDDSDSPAIESRTQDDEDTVQIDSMSVSDGTEAVSASLEGREADADDYPTPHQTEEGIAVTTLELRSLIRAAKRALGLNNKK
ncbi:hypothetical protein RYH80_18475 [Halobaculum sp. MBLA0147]|uniref:hypothetical protein n=1 Tax=Halobaculum sp. MBLA0147 TaxID=3079934 RepID=UPI0035242EA3